MSDVPSPVPLLEVRDLEVRYGGIRALNGISLSVPAGSIVTLIGANGAGKSTTLRALSGLVPPAAGSIRFDGAEISGMPAHRIVAAGLAHVPEGRLVFPELTVLENLRMGAYLRNDRKGIAGDLEWVGEFFPRLKERRSQLAGTLSGGEQQMLAIGRALMARPRCLMLDEPSLGIAPLLVSFAGVALANEHLTIWSYFGVVVVALGIISLSWSSRARVTTPSAIWWALGTGVAIACYTVIDGYGVRASGNTLQYGATLFFCQSLMWLVAVSIRRGRSWIPAPKTLTLGALGGFISMVAYTIVLWGQTRTTLGVVSALRETGVLWAAMLGVFFFKEGRASTVILPAGLVAAGIVLLALG